MGLLWAKLEFSGNIHPCAECVMCGMCKFGQKRSENFFDALLVLTNTNCWSVWPQPKSIAVCVIHTQCLRISTTWISRVACKGAYTAGKVAICARDISVRWCCLRRFAWDSWKRQIIKHGDFWGQTWTREMFCLRWHVAGSDDQTPNRSPFPSSTQVETAVPASAKLGLQMKPHWLL